MIRAIIVDDEPHARRELEVLLDETERFEIVARCGNAVEGIKAVNREHPDVLFLDVHMPMIDGFEMLAMLDDERMPYVVFVTAYDEHALRAFEEQAIDYLLKPLAAERLQKTVERLESLLEQDAPRSSYALAPLSRLPCARQNRIKLVAVEDVEFVTMELTGAAVVTAAGRFDTDLTLKALEERTELSRCHRKYLVNLRHVDEIIKGAEGSGAHLATRSGHKVPVSRRHLKELKSLLGF